MNNFAIRSFLLAALLLVVGLAAPQQAAALSRKQSAQNAQAGANLFRDKGCGYCHGAQTEGTRKGPSLENLRKRMKAPAILNQILNGGQKMPAFADAMSHDEAAEIVAYLRAKHRPQPSPVPPAPAQPESNQTPSSR